MKLSLAGVRPGTGGRRDPRGTRWPPASTPPAPSAPPSPAVPRRWAVLASKVAVVGRLGRGGGSGRRRRCRARRARQCCPVEASPRPPATRFDRAARPHPARRPSAPSCTSCSSPCSASGSGSWSVTPARAVTIAADAAVRGAAGRDVRLRHPTGRIASTGTRRWTRAWPSSRPETSRVNPSRRGGAWPCWPGTH